MQLLEKTRVRWKLLISGSVYKIIGVSISPQQLSTLRKRNGWTWVLGYLITLTLFQVSRFFHTTAVRIGKRLIKKSLKKNMKSG